MEGDDGPLFWIKSTLAQRFNEQTKHSPIRGYTSVNHINTMLHRFKSSQCLNNAALHSEADPAFLGTSQASLCGLNSQTLSFPDIVYSIILVPGFKSRVIQHFLDFNLFMLPCFCKTLSLNAQTTDCASLSPFSH